MSTHSVEKSSDRDVDRLSPLETAKVVKVENVDFAKALSTGRRLKVADKRSIQLIFILLVAYMGSLANGFDGLVMSAINGMEQYLTYFNIDTTLGGGVGTTTAIIFGIYSIGSIVGVFFAGPISDHLGRRGGMCIGSLFVMAGAIVATLAKTVPYLLGGRFALGFGVTITTTAAPAYVVEMAPPQWRGRMTGMYNTFYFAGSILCTGVTVATGKLESSNAWRIPLALQIIPAAILFFLSYALPESPRWLMAHGRNDEARNILVKYHGNDDPDAALVKLEWREFEESIRMDATDKRWWDYSGLFKTRNARYRTFMTLLMGFFGQWSGNGLGYFLPILFGAAGVNTQNQRLVLNFANTIVAASGSVSGSLMTDKVGRRPMWFWGTLTCVGTLTIITVCTAKMGESANPNSAIANTAIAFIFLTGFVFSWAYTPLQVLYPVECLEYSTRAKGMAMLALAVNCASFVNTYAGPIALQRMGWKYYIVYIVWDLFECIVIWFCAIETKGRTLEQLDEIFESANPVRASITKHEVTIANEGR